jgi:tetratricopeptide (TPR) repeat protein
VKCVTVARPDTNGSERARLIHREFLQILALIVLAAAAFVLTDRLEASNRALARRDAVEWYQRGSSRLQTGDLAGAIDAFRRATIRSRSDRTYAIALADALARSGRSNEARLALLAMREAAPDDAAVNLQLARLAAAQDDVTEAVRFYQSALYTPSTLGSADLRRQTRGELIRFLLAHAQPARAGAELIALSTDLPDTAAAHLEIGRLFAQAGEKRRALDQFVAALQLEPRNADALAAAGLAAFSLDDYPLAARYLRPVAGSRPEVKDTYELVRLVLSRDPLAARIRSAERERRLNDALTAVGVRLGQCLAEATDTARAPLAQVAADVQAFAAGAAAQRGLTADTVEDGVDLIVQAEQQIVQHCPPATLLDTAWITIGRLHMTPATP